MFCQKIFLKTLQNSQKNIFTGIYFLIKLQAENLKLPEAATKDVQWNKVFFKISQISQESIFNKVAILRAATLLKKAPMQVVSCKICEIFKNNCFEEHLWTTASKLV